MRVEEGEEEERNEREGGGRRRKRRREKGGGGKEGEGRGGGQVAASPRATTCLSWLYVAHMTSAMTPDQATEGVSKPVVSLKQGVWGGGEHIE